MQKVGVQAVVEGLGAFIRDTRKMNNALKELRPQGTLLQRVFSGVTDTLKSFGREILNVAEFALGQLLSEAIQFVIQKLGELIKATIEAGAEFQTMELRLNRLNFNSIIEASQTIGQAIEYTKQWGKKHVEGIQFMTESSKVYKQALKGATEATKEQLEWIQKLAVQTPYDFQDIANVFTLARSYSFTAEESKKLTENITDFAAGMGLGNVEIERIIVNFGQMVQQGKVTQRELNDLARGAFVPVNDIVARMSQNVAKLSKQDLKALSKATGLSTTQLLHMADGTKESEEAFKKFKSSTEGVNAFMQAFSDVVEERFSGAADDMAKTFQGATDNAQDLIKSLVGFGVVRPVLNQIGSTIANLITQLTSEDNWEKLTTAAERVGTQLALVFQGLFRKLPDSSTLAEGIIAGLNSIADWIDENRGKIVAFFLGIGTAIQNKLVPFIKRIVDGFNLIRAWVTENSETIKNFFTALGNILASIFGFDTGGAEGFLANFLLTVTSFMQYVIANQDSIAYWAELILKAFLAFQVLATILNIVIGIIISVIGFFIAVAAAVAGFIGMISALVALVGAPFLAVMSLVVAAIGFVIGMFLLAASIVYYFRDTIITMATTVINTIQAMVAAIVTRFLTLIAQTKITVGTMIKIFQDGPWGSIGRGIVDGIRKGVMHAAASLAAAAARVVERAIAAARRAAEAFSPSHKGEELGDDIILGVKKGIEDSAAAAIRSMQDTVKMLVNPSMIMPALTQQYAVSMPAGVSNNHNYTNNFNLTVNSRSPVEPIIQDYNMMRSLIQG